MKSGFRRHDGELAQKSLSWGEEDLDLFIETVVKLPETDVDGLLTELGVSWKREEAQSNEIFIPQGSDQ